MATYLATVQIGRYAVERQPGGATSRCALVAPPARMPAGYDAAFGRPAAR